MTKAKTIKETCCKCSQPAVAYWPAIDPDIESHPYCRKCCDEEKIKLLKEMEELDWRVSEEEEVDY